MVTQTTDEQVAPDHPKANMVATLDYILEKHVGGIGKWQIKNSILVLLLYYTSMYPLFITVFTIYAPDHRCHVKHCDVTNDTVQVIKLVFFQFKSSDSSQYIFKSWPELFKSFKWHELSCSSSCCPSC
jgi:hypothetical protein